MWFLRRRAKDVRNVLFDAALEFGENWRRDVAVLAGERLPTLDQDERAGFAKEVEDARSSIEQWVLSRWEAVQGDWSRADAKACEAFIRAMYPWMDDRNVAHAISQSTYYAWHG